jgi:hypothetical protein
MLRVTNLEKVINIFLAEKYKIIIIATLSHQFWIYDLRSHFAVQKQMPDAILITETVLSAE